MNVILNNFNMVLKLWLMLKMFLLGSNINQDATRTTSESKHNPEAANLLVPYKEPVSSVDCQDLSSKRGSLKEEPLSPVTKREEIPSQDKLNDSRMDQSLAHSSPGKTILISLPTELNVEYYACTLLLKQYCLLNCSHEFYAWFYHALHAGNS